jgi:cytochrome c
VPAGSLAQDPSLTKEGALDSAAYQRRRIRLTTTVRATETINIEVIGI